MKHSITFVPEILDEIRRVLEDSDLYMNKKYVIFITLAKKKLLKLDRKAVEFLENFVKAYKRGHRFLKPKSLREFLEQERYVKTDYVEFHIPVVKLIETGILKRVIHGGLVYWALGDEVLDPKKHVGLYKFHNDTLRTLFYELGYGFLVEKYRDKIEPNNIPPHDIIAILNFNNYKIEVCRDRFVTIFLFKVDKEGRLYRIYKRPQENRNIIEVEIVVFNPSPRDIEKMKEYANYTSLIVEELVHNTWIRVVKEVDNPGAYIGVSGHVVVENYKIKEISIMVLKVKRSDKVRDTVYAVLDLMKEKDNERYYTRTRVHICRSIASPYLFYAFRDIVEKVGEEMLPSYSIVIDSYDGEVRLEFNFTLENMLTPLGIAKHYIFAKRAKKLFKEIIERDINERIVEEIKELSGKGLGITVGDILDFVKWYKSKDVDEIIFKLAVLAIEGFNKVYPCILDKLVAITELKGYDYLKVTRAVKHPVSILLEFIRSGKLRMVPCKNGFKVFFKGRELSELLSFKHYTPTTFERVLGVLLSITVSEEVLGKSTRIFTFQ